MTVTEKNIVVIADVHGKPGHEAELAKVLQQAVAAIRSKDGCVLYRVQQDLADPAHFFLYEVWRDQAAADAHQSSDEFKALLQASAALTVSANLYRLKAIAE